jgi:hypothetical protein
MYDHHQDLPVLALFSDNLILTDSTKMPDPVSSKMTSSKFAIIIILLSQFNFIESATVQLFNLTAEDWQLSTTCTAVLNQAVNCDPALAWAGNGRFEDDDTLQAVCTSDCLTSLNQWVRRASGACTVRYNDTSGNAVLPAAWVENIVENYNTLCLTSK